MPTKAVNVLQLLSATTTEDSACTPRPFWYSVVPSVMGRPSLAACSPLDMSRSTGPQAFVLDTKGRSLIQCSPATGGGGGGTGRPTKRTSLGVIVVPFEVYVAGARSSAGGLCGVGPRAGARPFQLAVAGAPGGPPRRPE